MNWSKVGNSIAKFAPLLGGAVGGPAGAAIGTLVSTALGVDDSPEAVELALTTDPDAKIKLIDLQNRHNVRLEELSLEKLGQELADKADARRNHKHSKMPAVITFMLTIIVSGLLYALFNQSIPEDSKELAMMMFGQVFALWGASITYWVGTTRSSAEKDRRQK